MPEYFTERRVDGRIAVVALRKELETIKAERDSLLAQSNTSGLDRELLCWVDKDDLDKLKQGKGATVYGHAEHMKFSVHRYKPLYLLSEE